MGRFRLFFLKERKDTYFLRRPAFCNGADFLVSKDRANTSMKEESQSYL